MISVPDITIKQVSSIVQYGDGDWWKPLLKSTFRTYFKTELLIRDINYSIKKTAPYKKWIDEFFTWDKVSDTHECSYDDIKNILEIYKEFNEKLQLENELFDDQYKPRYAYNFLNIF